MLIAFSVTNAVSDADAGVILIDVNTVELIAAGVPALFISWACLPAISVVFVSVWLAIAKIDAATV